MSPERELCVLPGQVFQSSATSMERSSSSGWGGASCVLVHANCSLYFCWAPLARVWYHPLGTHLGDICIHGEKNWCICLCVSLIKDLHEEGWQEAEKLSLVISCFYPPCTDPWILLSLKWNIYMWLWWFQWCWRSHWRFDRYFGGSSVGLLVYQSFTCADAVVNGGPQMNLPGKLIHLKKCILPRY